MAYDKTFPKDQSFIGRDGQVVHPSMENSKWRNYVGQAYGFFNCRATADEIRAELPPSKKYVDATPDLEFRLLENSQPLEGSELVQSAQRRARDVGLHYVLIASLRGATNQKTAKETEAVLLNLYNTPLYTKDEASCAEVGYESDGRFVFLE